MSGRYTQFPAAETPKDFGTNAEGRARRWQAEIDKAHRERQEWFNQCRRILTRFKDEGPGRKGVGQDYTFGMRFNIFWSNVQTLAPSLYASSPKVVVERRWGDPDDVGRVACLILQRAAQYQLEGCDFDNVMRNIVQDHLICGQGTAWVRYEPHFDKLPSSLFAGLDALSAVSPGLAMAPPQGPAPPPLGPFPPGPGGGPPPPLPVPPAGPAPAPPGITAATPPGAPGAGGITAGSIPPPAAGPPPGGPTSSGPAAPLPGPMPPGPMPPPGPMAPPMPPPMLGPMPPGLGGAMPSLPSLSLPGGGPRDGGVQVADDGEDVGEFLAFEEVKVDHVHWEDWFCSPARTWQEVRWVARRVYMTKDEVRKRFGRKLSEEVPLDWIPREMSETEAMLPENRLFRRAQIYEIWDKPTRKVYWLAHGYTEKLLDEREDPLRLAEFFPTPRPIYATLTTESLIPVPDYQMYKDQAVQIDTLTARIEAVGKAIKVCGVYDAAQEGIQRVFAEGVENQLIPVNQWGAFSEQGGLKGCMDLLDIGMLAEVLGKLVEIRAQAKQDLYEVTGISDIIRGTTAASETATAQQIKAGFGTMRLRSRQNEVARFARDIIRLVSEVVCEHFSPRVLMLVSDIGHVGAGGDALIAPQAIQLLKDDKLRPLRIDIEADSTILANQQQEQQARIQFLTMAGQFLQQAIPAAQQTPQLAPLLGQMLLFGIRSFPQGAELESAFEQAVKVMEDAAKTAQSMPQQAPPDPKMVVAQAQVRNIDSQIADRQQDNMRLAQESAQKGRLEAARLAIEKQKADDAAAHETMGVFHDRAAEERNFVLEAAIAREKAQTERMKARSSS